MHGRTDVTTAKGNPPINKAGATRDEGDILYMNWTLHVGDRSFVHETTSTGQDRHSAATTKQWLAMDETGTLWDGLDVAETGKRSQLSSLTSGRLDLRIMHPAQLLWRERHGAYCSHHHVRLSGFFQSDVEQVDDSACLMSLAYGVMGSNGERLLACVSCAQVIVRITLSFFFQALSHEQM